MHRLLTFALLCFALGCDDAEPGGNGTLADAAGMMTIDATRPDADVADATVDAAIDAGPGCTPDCTDRVCGSDGCGGACGACPPEAICDPAGQCVARPSACGDDICSADETCATCAVDCGNCCGDGQCAGDETCARCAMDCACPGDETCNAQTEACEACEPQCDGRECGPDGCGQTCGACPDDVACVNGLCEVACQPDCTGRTCGDDGCGGECGQCAPGAVCTADGICGAAPPRCGDGMCTADEDCATCADDCGACCGNGVCGAGETCATCEQDCACAAGERCDAERRACVPECVRQCNGRNCGDDGCGGVCGDCAAAQACEAGVCVDVCQPDCTGRVCGGDGCGGRCGECAADARCTDGRCEAICQPDCTGRVCGDDGCGGTCGVCDEDARCTDGRCELICQPDCAGRVCGDDGCGGSCGACGANAACTDAGQCAPDGPIVASGTYERETVGGDDSMTIRVDAPVVFAAIPGGQLPCGLDGTMELAQDARLLGNAVSLRGANTCGRILTVLEPGDYTLRFFSDRDPVDRYTVRIAMTPIGPAALPGSGIYGRRGAAGDAVDMLTMQIDAPSILRLRIDGGLGQCVDHIYSITTSTGSVGPVGPRCFDTAVSMPIPPGPLTLTLQDEGVLSPYVLHIDVERIPNDSARLPRSFVLKQADREMVFVDLAVPSQVDFALETPDGRPCNVALRREPYVGYTRAGAVETDQPCRWSRELAPGIHGYAYRQENGAGAVFDRRVTITPLSNGINGPGRYARPAVQAPETLEFVLNAPQAVRIFAEDAIGCLTQPMTLIRADGVRIESEQRVREPGRQCDILTAMVPAGVHQLERTGQAGELVVAFGPRVDGSQSVARAASDWPGDLLALHGPADTLLYMFEHDGTGACTDNVRTERYLEGYDRMQYGFRCFPVVIAPDGPIMLRARARNAANVETIVTPRTYDITWSPIEQLPVQSVRPARIGLDVLSVLPSVGLMTVTPAACQTAPSLDRAGNEGAGYPGATSPCGTIAALTDAVPYRIERINPVEAATWSVQMVEDTIGAPEMRPLPRTARGGAHALSVTVERAGVLHARFDTPGAPCASLLEGVSLFSTSGARQTVINDCEASIPVQAGDRVGVLIAAEPNDVLSGSLETFFE